MKKSFAVLVRCFLLSGCIPEENQNNKIVLSEEDRQALESASTTKEQITYLYQNFEPVLNRDDTLNGVDTDENGIRDDIDEFINALVIPENERDFFRQNARYLQTVFDYDYSGGTEIDVEIAYAHAVKYDVVINCLIQLNLNWDDATGSRRMLDAMTLNTKLRSQHYTSYNKTLDGSAFEILEPTGDDCE
ncbi:chromosome partitioning protein ParA [Vibrio sp. 16]|uniref:chromosome partitioning protein ParA n=1 Tax=Vibrio sp. 16 TaxID=391586 RepID=UPI002FF42FD0